MCSEFISIERKSGDLAVEMFRDIDIVVCVEGLDAGVNPKSGFGQSFVGEDLSDRVVPEPLCAGCCRFEGYAMIAEAIGGVWQVDSFGCDFRYDSGEPGHQVRTGQKVEICRCKSELMSP